MAPEQLEGAEADPRTDLFALGALLYEMATARRAFEGKSKTSLIAAILSTQPPPISSVQPVMPPALDHVVRKCLEKDPDDRWQSAHDVASELRWIGDAGSQAGVPTTLSLRRRSRERLAWGLVALLAAATAGLAFVHLRRSATPALALRAENTLIPFDELGMALSPDGRQLAFVAIAGDGSKKIWVRDLSEMSARPLPETAGAWYPFWSPDGRHIGFFAEGKLKRIDLRGGSPQVIAEAPSGRGGSWGRGDVILFSPNVRSAIHQVPATGGTPAPVTRFDPEKETTHRWPYFLPDGKHFLYLLRARVSGKPEVGRLMLASTDSPDATMLIDDATNADPANGVPIFTGYASAEEDAVAKVLTRDLGIGGGSETPLVDSSSEIRSLEPKITLDFLRRTKLGDLCPECGNSSFVNEEGCRKCYACSYSEC